MFEVFCDPIMVMHLFFLDKADSKIGGVLPVDASAEDIVVIAEGQLGLVHVGILLIGMYYNWKFP